MSINKMFALVGVLSIIATYVISEPVAVGGEAHPNINTCNPLPSVKTKADCDTIGGYWFEGKHGKGCFVCGSMN